MGGVPVDWTDADALRYIAWSSTVEGVPGSDIVYIEANSAPIRVL